jgi:hypothetical protein
LIWKKLGCSAAAPKGRNAPDSDFDLFVVTTISDGDAGFDYDVVYAPIRKLCVGCDVVPCRADEFEDERDDPDTEHLARVMR